MDTPTPPAMMPQSNSLELQQRMQSIRAKRTHRVAEFQNEAERVTDWREHVKSAPIVSLVGSTLLGYFAIQSARRLPFTAAPMKPESMASNQHQETSIFPSGYFRNSLTRVLTGMILSAGKAYLTNQLNTQTKNPKP